MTELTTARLTLRPPRICDFDDLYALTATSDMRRFLGADEPSRADSFTRLLRNAGSWSLYGYGSFMVFERAEGVFIGTCGMFHSHRGLGMDFDNHAEAGWIIAQDQWGKGYAVEAMVAALTWFDRVHGNRVVAMIETGNIASENVAAKLGFVPLRDAKHGTTTMQLFRRN